MPSDVRFGDVRRLLEDAGWRLDRVTGSHHIFVKPGQRSFPVPVHRGMVKFIYVRKAKNLTQK